MALANSPEEKRKRENRFKRFEKGQGNQAELTSFRPKTGGGGSMYTRRAGALLKAKTYEDGCNKAVEDIDWDSLTVKGTCQEIEKRYLRLTSAPDPSTVIVICITLYSSDMHDLHNSFLDVFKLYNSIEMQKFYIWQYLMMFEPRLAVLPGTGANRDYVVNSFVTARCYRCSWLSAAAALCYCRRCRYSPLLSLLAAVTSHGYRCRCSSLSLSRL
ncbi:hypothetical protein GW17_00007808 [Ensete ventricosum]|nr:hypothetical protein GW17_00007808 [Ensete ventricosum]